MLTQIAVFLRIQKMNTDHSMNTVIGREVYVLGLCLAKCQGLGLGQPLDRERERE